MAAPPQEGDTCFCGTGHVLAHLGGCASGVARLDGFAYLTGTTTAINGGSHMH